MGLCASSSVKKEGKIDLPDLAAVTHSHDNSGIKKQKFLGGSGAPPARKVPSAPRVKAGGATTGAPPARKVPAARGLGAGKKGHPPPRKIPSASKMTGSKKGVPAQGKVTSSLSANAVSVKILSNQPVSSGAPTPGALDHPTLSRPAKPRRKKPVPKTKEVAAVGGSLPTSPKPNRTDVVQDSPSLLKQKSRQDEYFQKMKEQKRQEEDLANNLRAEKLANMDEEEREAFLEMEKEAEEHKKKQERMLQRQMKAYKKGGKKKKLVGGRGKKKKKGKMQV